MLNRIVEDPATTILCVGAISEEKRLSMGSNPTSISEYRNRIKERLVELLSKGYRSILFCRWGYFDRMVAECVREMNLGRKLFPMAVLRNRRYGIARPLPDGFFEFIIYLSEESIELNDEEIAEALLSNASAILYDNEGDDPAVDLYLNAVGAKDISLIDLNGV